MFAGHLAVAMAAKHVEPRAPLGVLVAASFGLDLVWPLLLLAGLETVSVEVGATAFTPLSFDSYPWSHSLVMVLLWGVIAGLAVWRVGWSGRIAVVTAALVVSHWVLDFVTHRPDLPLWLGGPEVGLMLWSSVPATLVVEGLMLVGGAWLYARAAPARDRLGTVGLIALVLFVGAIWASGPFSPPPPSATAVAYVALALWIFPFWAWRIDVHRGSHHTAPVN